jgi:hypothetical protein
MIGPSSVYRKLRTNARLTNEEEAEVRRATSESFNELRAAEKKAARLQERLVVLRQRKKKIENLIDIHQGLLSPIRRVPLDVLQEIFWRCLPSAHNSVLSFKQAPLVFGLVCRRWRQIIYSTPRLWTSLHIVIVPLTCPRAAERFGALKTWLAGSGVLPLSISMSGVKGNHMTMHEFRPYFELIAKHTRRWKCVHLQVALYEPMDSLMKINADDLPMLEVFHIERNPLMTTGDPLSRRGGILFAPSLRVLSLHEFSLSLPDLPVRWSQLTGLDFGGTFLNLPDISKLLTLVSNLESCIMNLGIPADSLSSPTNQLASDNKPELILPKLRTLKIYGQLSQNNGSLTLLDNLSTPALRHFANQHSFWPPIPFAFVHPTEPLALLNIIRSFFQRLNEPLEELEFYVDGFTTKYLMEFLSLFPALKRISLRYSFDNSFETSYPLFNDRLLSGFIPYEHRNHCKTCLLGEEQAGECASAFPSSPCLCPNLEVLNVENAFLSQRILLEYLRSRLVDYAKYGITRLRRFSISFYSKSEDDPEDMRKEVDRLAEDSGLLVELGHLQPTICRQSDRSFSYKYSPYEGVQAIFGP